MQGLELKQQVGGVSQAPGTGTTLTGFSRDGGARCPGGSTSVPERRCRGLRRGVSEGTVGTRPVARQLRGEHLLLLRRVMVT